MLSCLDEQMNKKSGLSSGGKDRCKPNIVARRGPSMVSRPSDSLARLRGASLHFFWERTGKHEITCLNQQRLSSPENGKANYCRCSCTTNCGKVSEHSSLPSHPSKGLGLNKAHSLWFSENKHKIIGFNDNRQVESSNAEISVVDKSLSGIKNGPFFTEARASRPQYISHFKLAHAWAETGLASISVGLAVRVAF